MDLNQSASDSTIRVYGPKIPSPNTPYSWILLYAPDFASSTPSSKASNTEAEVSLLRAYRDYTTETCGVVLAPEVLWPLAQSNASSSAGQEDGSLHENIWRKCHSNCHITCLLPEALWDLVSKICTLGAQERTQTAQSLARDEDNRTLLFGITPSRADVSLLYNSDLWRCIEGLGGSRRTPAISLFVDNEEKPLEDFVRGMKVLAAQEEAKDSTAGGWIQKTALWKLCQVESNREAEGVDEYWSSPDAGVPANTRQRARTDPLHQLGGNYTWKIPKQPVHSSWKESTPRTMPKVDMSLFTPRGKANGTSARCFD